jgi:hypothetical protein
MLKDFTDDLFLNPDSVQGLDTVLATELLGKFGQVNFDQPNYGMVVHGTNNNSYVTLELNNTNMNNNTVDNTSATVTNNTNNNTDNNTNPNPVVVNNTNITIVNGTGGGQRLRFLFMKGGISRDLQDNVTVVSNGTNITVNASTGNATTTTTSSNPILINSNIMTPRVIIPANVSSHFDNETGLGMFYIRTPRPFISINQSFINSQIAKVFAVGDLGDLMKNMTVIVTNGTNITCQLSLTTRQSLSTAQTVQQFLTSRTIPTLLLSIIPIWFLLNCKLLTYLIPRMLQT